MSVHRERQRKPDHARRYEQLVIRHPTGETEGVHPKDADPAILGEIHKPGPLLRIIRAKCIDCSAGSEAEVRKCTAINCALWPYRMGSNPYRTRTISPEHVSLLVEARRKRRASAPAPSS